VPCLQWTTPFGSEVDAEVSKHIEKEAMQYNTLTRPFTGMADTIHVHCALYESFAATSSGALALQKLTAAGEALVRHVMAMHQHGPACTIRPDLRNLVQAEVNKFVSPRTSQVPLHSIGISKTVDPDAPGGLVVKDRQLMRARARSRRNSELPVQRSCKALPKHRERLCWKA
jgi:hypothetical protein